MSVRPKKDTFLWLCILISLAVTILTPRIKIYSDYKDDPDKFIKSNVLSYTNYERRLDNTYNTSFKDELGNHINYTIRGLIGIEHFKDLDYPIPMALTVSTTSRFHTLPRLTIVNLSNNTLTTYHLDLEKPQKITLEKGKYALFVSGTYFSGTLSLETSSLSETNSPSH